LSLVSVTEDCEEVVHHETVSNLKVVRWIPENEEEFTMKTKVLGISICFALALLTFPDAAPAQFLVVDCSGLNPFAFPTI
jgi:hypothetical protein